MAAQNISRAQVLAPAGGAAAAVPEERQVQVPRDVRRDAGHDAAASARKASTRSQKFLEAGGTLIAADSAVRFPIEFGFAQPSTPRACTGVNAQKPLVQAEIVRTDHPVFYGYAGPASSRSSTRRSQTFFRVGAADQGNVLARFVGGDAAVLSGLMVGGDAHPPARVRGRRARAPTTARAA